MGVTISTHNGSVVAREHNIRNRRVTDKEPHIDREGKHEIWLDEKVRDAYERLFGDAKRAYNEKQKRENRKIKSYYNAVCKDAKKHPVYEMIIGVYGKDENGKTICSESEGKEIMKEFVEGWKDRNPNLEMIGAYYHADEEGEPHVHIDYIPVAHGYTKGMETQTGLVKAFGEMGFEKQGKLTAQIQWEARENKVLDTICQKHGLEVEHPREENRKHISTEQYKAEKSLDSAIENTKDLLDQQDALREETSHLEAVRNKANIQTQKALERRARAVKLHKNKDGQGWTYDEGLVRGVKDLAKEIKEDVKSIAHTDLDVEAAYERARTHESNAERKAQEHIKAAEDLQNKAQKYLEDQQNYILGTANNLAERKFKEFKEKVFPADINNYTERLENFCKEVKYNDGTTVFDRFQKQEKELEQEINRGWSR